MVFSSISWPQVRKLLVWHVWYEDARRADILVTIEGSG